METFEKTVVTYDVQAPVEFEIKSTANGQGASINALWYGVYHKKENGNYVYMSDMSAYITVTDPSKKISVPITLFKDQKYKIIFVAQYIASGTEGNCYTYIINENGHMSLNPQAKITDGEQLDAFVYWEETEKIKHDYKKEIELTRPLAQINISTTASTRPTTVDIKVKGTAQNYDIFAGTYSDSVSDIEFKGLACNGEQLATVYLIPPVSGKVDLEMTMDQSAQSKEVPGIAVAPNFKTNVTGNI